MSAPHPLAAARSLAALAKRDPIAFTCWFPNQHAFLASQARCKQIRQGNQWGGKEQPVDEPVLTPSGWRPIGELRVGDAVFAGDGSITEVVGVFPQGEKDTWRLTFSDGATTRCGADHLWKVKTARERFAADPAVRNSWQVLTLAQIRSRWGDAPRPKYQVEIPRPVVQGVATPLPVDPWLVGVLLGDGCTRGSLSFCSMDPEIVDRMNAILASSGNVLTRKKHPSYADADSPYYRIGRPGGSGPSPLLASLRELGMWNVIGHEKRAPSCYMQAPASARLEVLRGLMDTDGEITDRGHCRLSTSSPGLASDVVDICRSLGGTAHITTRPSYLVRDGVAKRVRDLHTVHLRMDQCPAWLPRKVARWKPRTRTSGPRLLRSIEPSGRAECVCIAVAHPDHTYITRDFIVTHNTWAALAEVIGRCVGRHPLGALGFAYPPAGPGFEAWVICDSWSQAVAIMGKIRALLPEDDVEPATLEGFNPGTGFRGKNPIVRFRNGAILRIKTANQDPKSLASGTIDVALFDEPPPNERIFTEVQQRLQTKGGVLLLSYTPVNAPVAYLRDYVAEGKIEDHWSPLTAAALIPVGKTRPVRGPDGRLRDQAWIDELRAQVPTVQAPVVIDGEWEFRAVGAYFEGVWDPTKMVHPHAPTGEVTVCLGFDHGDRPGKQVHLLILVEATADGPKVYVLDEYTDTTGRAGAPEDARGTLAILERAGLRWRDVDYAFGDRVHMPGSGQQKSNKDLGVAIARAMKIPVDALMPPIRTVKRGAGRGAGSLSTGSRWLHYVMARERFAVHPRCTRLIEALPKYTLADDDSKDPIDALRYGLDHYIFAGPRRGASPTVAIH